MSELAIVAAFADLPDSHRTAGQRHYQLRGAYEANSDDPSVESHPAMMLVTAYLVERGLILEP